MPLHKRRTWVIDPAEYTPEELAIKLIDHSWCSCQGWRIGRYLFLNDQTSPDGAFEVAIVRAPEEEGGQWYQVESVTFGWLTSTLVLMQHWQETGRRETPHQLGAGYIRNAVAGKCDPEAEGTVAWAIEPPRIETPEQHGRCAHCA
jgi:hypothetical protein